MKKSHREKMTPAPTDLRRRQLLLALGLAGSGGLALARSDGPRKEKDGGLLSLREADFYHYHDLVG